MNASAIPVKSEDRYWQTAILLAVFTILYNLLEGLVAVYFGIQDDALTLFGFGLDSFVEVISGVGILSMVRRIRKHNKTERSHFERIALRVTGLAFYILAAGLAISAVLNLVYARKPVTTIPGFLIALVSIAIMWALVRAKRKVGRVLQSAPILADANCTLTCIYMSLVLLGSSFVYSATGIGFIDSLGAIGLVYFSLREGHEAFANAQNHECVQCSVKSQGEVQ